MCDVEKVRGVESEETVRLQATVQGVKSFNHLNVEFFICTAEVSKYSAEHIKQHI